MPLTLSTRYLGDVVVVTCRGRIVEGPESAALKQALADVATKNPCIMLNMGAVDAIDSSGLGLLVRFLSRLRNAGGDLVLCAVPRRIAEALRVTKLSTIFDGYDSEDEAVRRFYRRKASAEPAGHSIEVICVDSSADVLAYVRTVLGQSGYRVISSDNVADALLLFRATAPKVVVVGSEVRATTHTRSGAAFNRAIDACAIIELPQAFGSHDPAVSSAALLDQLRAIPGMEVRAHGV
jgi:anti-anti-sigma factor